MGLFSKYLSYADNLARNPSKVVGRSGIRKRIGMMSMYMAPAMATVIAADNFAQQQRAYLGDDRYNSYYGDAENNVKALAIGAGAWFGFGALMGRDPVSKIVNSGKLFSFKAVSSIDDSIRTILNRSSASRSGPYARMGGSPAGPAPSGPLVDRRAQQLEKLKSVPLVGIKDAIVWSSILGGRSAGSEYYPHLGAVAGAAALSLTAAGITKVKGWAGTSVFAAGAYAGYLVGDRINNPSAEGTITDFSTYNSRGVSRMNFSTAGLVQALHYNNRRA